MRGKSDPGLMAGLIGYLVVGALTAHAGGWSDNPKVQEWLKSAPVHTCCAMADGFLADEYDRVRPGEGHTEGGVIAHITDDDSDPPCWEWHNDEDDTRGTTCRRKVPQQRDYFVPESSIVYAPPNPTGHGVLFLNNGAGAPRCYFLPSGA
jgi:hypothetical protein